MDERLLPCPFCGSTKVDLVPYNQVHHDDECECYNGSCDSWAVNCDASGTSSEGYAGGCGATAGAGMTREQAIENWNRRAVSATCSGEQK